MGKGPTAKHKTHWPQDLQASQRSGGKWPFLFYRGVNKARRNWVLAVGWTGWWLDHCSGKVFLCRQLVLEGEGLFWIPILAQVEGGSKVRGLSGEEKPKLSLVKTTSGYLVQIGQWGQTVQVMTQRMETGECVSGLVLSKQGSLQSCLSHLRQGRSRQWAFSWSMESGEPCAGGLSRSTGLRCCSTSSAPCSRSPSLPQSSPCQRVSELWVFEGMLCPSGLAPSSLMKAQ